jgi:hypothetical protein
MILSTRDPLPMLDASQRQVRAELGKYDKRHVLITLVYMCLSAPSPVHLRTTSTLVPRK